MKYYILILILFFQLQISSIYAQKPVIDSSTYDKWPLVQNGYISNDGKYISYVIDKQPMGRTSSVIRSIEGGWEMKSTESYFAITADSRKTIFKKTNDSLAILTLGTDSVEIIPNVKSYNVLSNNQDSWLVFYMMDPAKDLFIRNLGTNLTYSISGVVNYFSNSGGIALVVKHKLVKNGKVTETLDWVDLSNGNVVAIWEGTGLKDEIIFNKQDL